MNSIWLAKEKIATWSYQWCIRQDGAKEFRYICSDTYLKVANHHDNSWQIYDKIVNLKAKINKKTIWMKGTVETYHTDIMRNVQEVSTDVITYHQRYSSDSYHVDG